MRNIIRAWLPAVAYMTFIWVLSSGTHDISFEQLPFKDKAAHFCEYGLLGLLTAHAVLRTWTKLPVWRALLLAALLTSAWGFFDELHQAFVPGRDSDAMDLLADTLGGFVGAFCFRVIERFLPREVIR